jgi:formamidopyrimidine-DNA glycosylase
MPELPEVETIARGLDGVLRGRIVAGIDVHWQRTVDGKSLALELLVGDEIVAVGRTGKFLTIAFLSGRTLAIHLRMTGRLTVARPQTTIPHERLAIRFRDGDRLAFGDARKFGRVRLLDGDAARSLGVGIDALSKELDELAFAALLRGRSTPIKALLLDQRRLAGVGNIYACEALFRARIRPKRRASRLTEKQRSRLLREMRVVLEKAIKLRGSSVDDYVDAEGLPGSFQKLLSVYGRAGLPCRRCRTPIKRIVLAQRGTFFCPACQQ